MCFVDKIKNLLTNFVDREILNSSCALNLIHGLIAWDWVRQFNSALNASLRIDPFIKWVGFRSTTDQPDLTRLDYNSQYYSLSAHAIEFCL